MINPYICTHLEKLNVACSTHKGGIVNYSDYVMIATTPKSNANLSAVLDYASQHVPRYRGLVPILDLFPILTKQSALADIAAQISGELGSKKAELVEFICDDTRRSGSNQESFFEKKIMVEETSGSSGIPFRTAKTLEERSFLALGIWKYRKKYDPLCTPRNFYTISHAPAGFQAMGVPRIFTQANIDKYYTRLSAHQMRWVHCGPGTLRKQASVISPSVAASKSICFAESSGEALPTEAKRFIEENLRVSVIDQYGCRETWAIATRSLGPYFEVLSDNVIVELLDLDGQPIHVAGTQGRIVVTSLHQKIFPIIRYDTGDLGTWEDGAAGLSFHLSNYREHNIYRYLDRELDGNQLFKSILINAYIITGYINFTFIQIRQKSPNRFELVTNRSPNAAKLCAALNQYCSTLDKFGKETCFNLVELTESEVEQETARKHSLFTTKYMSTES